MIPTQYIAIYAKQMLNAQASIADSVKNAS